MNAPVALYYLDEDAHRREEDMRQRNEVRNRPITPGDRFNRLRAVAPAPSRGDHAYWNCICDCGNDAVVSATAMRCGRTRSCGCLVIEAGQRNRKHGGHGSTLYATWRSMRQRCICPTHHAYKNYGGRGITVCAQWADFATFAADMGAPPPGRHTLERIDVNGNYEPSNCIWADWVTQGNNRRNVKKYAVHGEVKSVTELARQYQVTARGLRLAAKRGESMEDAIQRLSTGKRFAGQSHA